MLNPNVTGATTAELPRRLGLVDAANLVIGIVIGSAIFLVPGEIARSLPGAGMILTVWVVTGILSLLGALAYAELGAMMPATGGQYVYLREAYGPLVAFLCGWCLFTVILSGGTATLATGFAIYVSYFVPLRPMEQKLVAVGMIALLSWINYRGVKEGVLVQNLFTFLKVAGILVLLTGAFLAPAHAPGPNTGGKPFTFSAFGVAMIACLWAYEGWNCLSFVAGEVREPKRNIPLGFGLGMAVVVGLYLLANLAYLHVLPVSAIAASERVASDTAQRSLGPWGGAFVTIAILVSIAGAMNGSILTSARVPFEQARDGLLLQQLGKIHPRFQTPGRAIVLSGIWTALLAVTGSYQILYSYVIFSAWIFYGLTVLAVPILRRREPNRPRPYRMPGYPATPWLFAAVAFWFVGETFLTSMAPSMSGLAIVAAGIPVYYWCRSRGHSRPLR